jgi:hypothetical protein
MAEGRVQRMRNDAYGARRDDMRGIFETEGDWGRLLASFAQVAASSLS